MESAFLQAVHFGAGNIGRGFIGQLLRESGYAVDWSLRRGRLRLGPGGEKEA